MSGPVGEDGALRRAGRRAAVGHAAGSGLVAALCAASLAPVIAADPGQAGAAVAGLVGSVGGNVLTDVVTGVVDKLRGGQAAQAPLSAQAVERALADALEVALDGDGSAGKAMSRFADKLLREADAVRTVIEGAASADPAAAVLVAQELSALADRMGESSAAARGLRDAVLVLEREVARSGADARAAAAHERERELLLECVLEALRGPGPDAEIAGPGPGACPYRGLEPFRVQDTPVFFGRARISRRLVRQVGARAAGGMLLLLGASGAGKSSLLHAGLVPALTRPDPGPDGQIARARQVRVFTVSADPMVDLAAALADLCGRAAGETAALLELDPARAAELAAQAAARDAPPGASPEPPVLVVDQLERLFTLSEPGDAGRTRREAFVRALHVLTTVPAAARSAPAVVVAALRADYLDRALELPVVAEAFAASNTFLIEAMTRAELREAVRGPADAVGVPVEPRLVEAVLQDAYGPSGGPPPGAGVLPLVSQAMASTWRLRRGRTLTLRAYQRAGRLTQAVDRSAERAYRSLDDAGRGAARTMFLLLTRVAEDGRAVRRIATRTELYAGAGVSTRAGNAVLEAFTSERLLVLDGQDVQICHDVLLDTWATLHTWLEGDPEARARYGELLSDADTWRNAPRRRGDHLYRAAQIEAVERAEPRWNAEAARYPIPPHVQDFLTASRRTVRRTRRTRTTVVGALAALTLAASAAAGIATVDAQHARALQAVALSRQLAAASLALADDPGTARQLAAAAWAVSPTQQATDAMNTLLNEQQNNSLLIDGSSVNSVAFNPPGTLLASADVDGTVRLWAPATGREVGTPIAADTSGQSAGVSGVAFNASGTLLASADSDGTVKLWNPATGREVGTPIVVESDALAEVKGVAFNASGTLLASADLDGIVRLWDPTTGREVGTPIAADTSRQPVGVNGVAFNASGTLLASADFDGTVKLWNPATGREVGTPINANTPDSTWSVAFNPSGTLLADDVGDPEDPEGSEILRWPTVFITSPYATLCSEVGAPDSSTWQQYAAGEPWPDICG